MSDWFAARWRAIKDMLDRRWVKIVGIIWALIGAYDLLANQLLPKSVADWMRPIREVISVTSGWLPWWAWGWMSCGLIAIAAVEYSVRLHQKTRNDGLVGDRRKLIPLREAATRLYESTRGHEVAEFAEGLGKGKPDGILTWCAHILLLKGGVVGCREPSRVLEPLPEADWLLDLRGDVFAAMDGSLTFVNLHIPEAILSKHIRLLLEIPIRTDDSSAP